MKIAVACTGLGVAPHAAQCESFMCYTVEKGIIKDCRNLPNMGITSAEAVSLIKGLDFDTLITGGIDMDTANELCKAGVEIVAGVQGTAREVAEAYLNRTLMGAVELCQAHDEAHDPEDQDVEDAFQKMALAMGL
ncbi:MAG: hypothetical protein IJO87_01515 [Eggerthellaceae bacterium]|nr:hypothetical protein [Eggerthellaceae bacterium]